MLYGKIKGILSLLMGFGAIYVILGPKFYDFFWFDNMHFLDS